MKTRSLKTNKVSDRVLDSPRMMFGGKRRRLVHRGVSVEFRVFVFSERVYQFFHYARTGANIGIGISTNKAKGSVLSTCRNSSEYLRL